jgi:hypothetical protein
VLGHETRDEALADTLGEETSLVARGRFTRTPEREQAAVTSTTT